MALASEINAQTFDGNNSTVTAYPVNFAVHSADHIRVEVKAAGEDVFTPLDPSEYTVHESAGVYSVTTDVAIPATSDVTIYRWVPLTQPLVLPLAGSLPAPGIERQLDSLTMQVQQVYRQISSLGDVTTPGASTIFGTAKAANAAARAALAPGFVGQLLVQTDDNSLWIGGSTAAGDWDQFNDLDFITTEIADGIAENFLAAGIYTVPDAVGDGVTNDGPAIQAKLDEAEAAGGGTVYLPPGTFRVNSIAVAGTGTYSGGYFYLQIPSNVTLQGAGMDLTTIVGHGSASAGSFGAVITAKGSISASVAYGGGFNTRIVDLTVATNAQADENGININICHADGFTCERVRIAGSKYHGVEWNQSRRGRFIDCVFSGEYSGSSSGSWIQFDVGASGPKSTLVTGVATLDVVFDRCRFEQRPSTDASARDVDLAHTSAFTVNGVKFIDCEFTGRARTGTMIIGFDSSNPGASVDSLQCVRCKFTTAHEGAYAVYKSHVPTGTGGARDWMFDSCSFVGPSKNPVRFGDSSSAGVTGHTARRNFVMRNSTVDVQVGSWTSAGSCIGVLVYAAGEMLLLDNLFRFTGTLPAAAAGVTLECVSLRNSTGVFGGNTISYEVSHATASPDANLRYGLSVNTSALETAFDAATAGAPTSGRLLIRGNRVGSTAENLNTTVRQVGLNDADGGAAGGSGSAHANWSILFSANSTFGGATSRHWNINRAAWSDGTNDVMPVEWGASGQSLSAIAGSAPGTVEIAGGTAVTFSQATPLIVGDTFIAAGETYTIATRTSDTVYTCNAGTARAAGTTFSVPPTVMVTGGVSFTRYLKIWQGGTVTGITFHRTFLGLRPRIGILFDNANTYASVDTSQEPMTRGYYWDNGATANKAVGIWTEYNGNTGAFSLRTGDGGVSCGLNMSTGAPAIRQYGQIEMSVGI